MAGLIVAAHRALAELIKDDVAIEDEAAMPAVKQVTGLVRSDHPLLDQNGGQFDRVTRVTAVIDGGLDLSALTGQKYLKASKNPHKIGGRPIIRGLEVWTSSHGARATLVDLGQRAQFVNLH
jgi:hypothetical protein